MKYIITNTKTCSFGCYGLLKNRRIKPGASFEVDITKEQAAALELKGLKVDQKNKPSKSAKATTAADAAKE